LAEIGKPTYNSSIKRMLPRQAGSRPSFQTLNVRFTRSHRQLITDSRPCWPIPQLCFSKVLIGVRHLSASLSTDHARPTVRTTNLTVACAPQLRLLVFLLAANKLLPRLSRYSTRISNGGAPKASANSVNSTASMRRSPRSHLDTKVCVLPSRCASSTCDTLVRLRVAMRTDSIS